MSFAVITENDTSVWKDQTGLQYHFPKRYKKILQEGTQIIYYKGKMINKSFENQRLSPEPHYFGTGKIGNVKKDNQSKKGDFFANITDFKKFDQPVPFKVNAVPLEEIPDSKKINYFRNGVRPISHRVFTTIVSIANSEMNSDTSSYTVEYQSTDESLESIIMDGNKKQIFGTRYERKRKFRDQAIKIHGLNCMACGMNFQTIYGEWGYEFIHVHHTKPVSEGVQRVNPATDLVVVCPNCHYMIHRKGALLTVVELQQIIADTRDRIKT